MNRQSWINELDEDDQSFLKRFLLASGSLKDLAQEYGISYPTIRNRLDRLIEKVKAAEQLASADEFERKIRLMVVDLKIAPATASELIRLHRSSLSKKGVPS